MHRKVYPYLAILVSLLIISNSVLATPHDMGIKLAGQPATTTPDPNRAAAQRAEEEAKKLDPNTTPITQVIAKQEEALKYWRLAGDKNKEARTLDRIAKLYFLRGEYPKALESARQALPICEELNDQECKGKASSSLARIYKEMGEYEKSIEFSRQVPALFPETPDFPAIISLVIGQIYGSDLGEKQKALDYYNQALAFWKEKGDAIKQAEALQNIAFFYFILGEHNKVLETIEQANTLDPEFKRNEGDSSQINLLYSGLASFICDRKLAVLKKPPTLEKLDSSSNQVKKPNPKNTNNFANFKGFEQEAQKYRTRELLGAEADSLDSLAGLGYQRIGEYQKALEVLQQVLKLRRFMGDKPEEAETLTSIAEIQNLQGKKQEAINALNEALEIERQLKTLPAEADTLSTLGDIYQSLGAYPLALSAYNQSLSLFRQIGARNDEAKTLSQIGSSYKNLQDDTQAFNYYQQALVISRTTGNCNEESKSLILISGAYLESGDYQRAIAISNEALPLARDLGIIEFQLARESSILTILARAEIKQGNYTHALESTSKARKLAQESGFRDIEAEVLATIAEAYTGLKQSDKAIETYQEQLTLYRAMGLEPDQAKSFYNIARLQQQSDKLPQALENIEQAIKIVENLRTTLASPDLRTTYFATVQDYYELKINILMRLHQKDPKQGYDKKAFETNESSRARTLLELLKEANADIRQGVDPKLLEAEKALRFRLNAIEKIRIEIYSDPKSTPEQKANIDKERQNLLDQYAEIQAKIRTNSPRYAALTQPKPLTLAEVQKKVLDPDTLLLQYSLGKDRSYLWLVSQDSMTSYTLPPRAEIENTAKAFRNLILYTSYRYDERGIAVVPAKTTYEAAPKLSQVLFGQIADKMTAKRLVIVADGALQYVPFSALPIPDQKELTPLVSQYEIVNLPSSSSLALIRAEKREKGTKTIAIFADPVFSADDERVTNHSRPKSDNNDVNRTLLDRSSRDLDIGNWQRLPGTRKEATAILSLIPDSQSSKAFDFNANFSTATATDLKQYKIIHYATHGLLNSVNPELSGIVLSMVDAKGNPENGFLRLNDIFNLDLGAELVVLSACQTGLGKEVKGEGLVGLTRGFMYAGSPRVLVSLWNVSDEATAEMMKRFYRLLLKEKLPAALALRQAQLELQKQTEYKSPYFWAAFTLQGEWR